MIKVIRSFRATPKYLLLFSIMSLMAACGEVVSTREFSTIITSTIGWRDVNNISSTNISSYPLTGTCTTEAGDVSVQIGTPMLMDRVFQCVNGRFSGSVDLSTVGLPEGSLTLHATQVGITADATTNLWVDTIPPAAPVILTPTAGSVVGQITQTVTGTCETGSTIIFSGDISNSSQTVCTGGNFSGTVTLTPGNGSKDIVVAQTDNAGNTSPTDSVTITYDASLGIPLAPTILTPANGALVNQVSQTVTGECEVGATVFLSGNITGAPVSVACSGAGTYSQVVTLTAANGLKTISAVQTNTIGTSPSVSISITLDNMSPVAPLITAPSNGSTTNQNTQTVTGTCENGATVTLTGDIIGTPITTSCTGGTFSEPVTYTGGDGPKTITATQTDPAGNTSPPTSVTVNVDQTAPAAPVITSPVDGTLTNQTAHTVIGTCEPNATVNISGQIVGGSTTAFCLAGNFMANVTLTSGDGTKNISANQTDLAGNTSGNDSIDLILDQTAPAAPTITAPTEGTDTNTTSQTVIGTCEDGASVSIGGNIVGAPVTFTCSGGNYSQPVTLTPGDGPKAITATQTDPAGNTSSTTTVNVNLDQTAPPAPTIVTPANNLLTNTTSHTVTGACEANATVNISGAGITGGPHTTTCSVGGTYSQPVTLTSGDGAKNISATQTDPLGNTSPATTVNVNLDQTAPAAPTITAPVDNSYTNTTSQTVVGACEDGASVSIGGNIVGAPVTFTCSGGTYSQPVTLISGDGTKAITATQTDPAGNTSSTTSIDIILDQTAPPAPTITAPTDGSFLNSTAQTVEGACEDTATVSLGGSIVGAPVTFVCSGGTYSENVTLISGDGPKTITATQTDVAGNTSGSTTVNVELITGVPAAPTIVTPANNLLTNTTSHTVTGACTPNNTVNILGAGITGGPHTTTCTAGGTYSQAVTLTAGDGSKVITATQTNLASVTSDPTSVTVNLDQTAPSAPTIVTPANNLLTNTTSHTVTGACEANATVNISGAGITGGPHATTCSVGGTYSQAVTLTAGDGNKTISATQTDDAGNTSPAANVTVVLDQTAPSAPVIVNPVNNLLTNTTSHTVTGTCEADATVNISGSGITGGPHSVTCTSGGTYSQPVTLTSGDGTKTITATQTDGAGNTSPSTSVTVNLDQTAPNAPTIVTPANNLLTNTTSHTVTGACEADATVNISGTGITGGPHTTTCTSGGTYSQAVTLTTGDGAKTITATQIDDSGNTSPSASVIVNLDQTAPTAPTIVTPANNLLTNTTSHTVTGACEADATVNISGTGITGGPHATTCTSGGTYSQAVTLTTGDGAKIITATQTDDAGNTSPAANVTVILDQTAPDAPTITSPVDESLTNSVSQTVIGACENNATVNISGDIVSAPVTASCLAGNYMATISFTPGDGEKVISATQTDLAGNTSTATSISLDLDTTPPPTPTITSPANNLYTNEVDHTITGACEAGATVNVAGAGISGGPHTTTCTVGGTYSQAVTLTSGDGAKVVSVSQTDIAGNSSVGSASITINFDQVRPSVVISSSALNPTSINPIPITITFSEDVTGFTVNDVLVTGGTKANFTGGPSVFTLNIIPDQPGTITVDVDEGVTTDAASNPNTAATQFEIDYEWAANMMVTRWELTAPDLTVSLPLSSGFNYNFTVDWGDGTAPQNVTSWNHANTTYTYAAPGTYDITITGVVEAWGATTYANGGCRITEVLQLGDMGWRNLANGFRGCADLVNFNNGITNLSNVNNISNMFRDASLVDPDVSGWNVSQVTNMSGVFYNAGMASAPVDSWNVSNVTDMSNLFRNAQVASPNVEGWNVSNVTNMSGMFYDAISFTTLDLTGWDVSGVTNMSNMFRNAFNVDLAVGNWNVNQVTDMSYMFAGTYYADPDVDLWLNSPNAVENMEGMFMQAMSAAPAVDAWNVSGVTNMSYMFADASMANPAVDTWNVAQVTNMAGMFSGAVVANPDVSAWDVRQVTDMSYMFNDALVANPDTTAWNVRNVTNMEQMFTNSGLTTRRYTEFLIMANTTTLQDNVTLHSRLNYYWLQADAPRTNLITNRGWTIYDLGMQTISPPTIVTPANNSYVNTTAQTVTGTCINNGTVYIQGTGVTTQVSGPCTGGNYSINVTLTSGEGTKVISAYQINMPGAMSSTVSVTVTLDQTAPGAPTIVTPVNNLLTNSTSHTVTGACEPNATVNISGAGITGGPHATTCSGGGTYSQAVTLTSGDGNKVISATQTDLAGNTSPSASVTVNLDQTPPSAPTIVTPADGLLTNSTSHTVTGACEPNATVNISGAGITGGPHATTCSGGGTYSQAVTLTSGDGNKVISATQTDLAGNTSSATTVNVELDQTAPAAPTIVTPVDGSTTDQLSHTVTGACEPDATVNISGAGITGGPHTTTCTVGGTYSQAITLTSGDGVKAISATQTDLAGNTSLPTNITVTLDTTPAPSLAIVTPAAGSALVPSVTFTITGTCDAGGGIVTLSGTAMVQASVTGSCTGGGTFSINATAVASGQNLEIHAVQVDSASVTQNAMVDQIMIHCAGAAMRSCALAGSGNPVDPYSISTISCLQEMRTGLTCHYELANNIDATVTSTWNSGRGWEPIPNNANLSSRFRGTLNGNNHTISNLFITPRFAEGTGIFSRIYDEGNSARDEQVYDLTLSNPTFDLYDIKTPFGFIAGRAEITAFRNINIVNGNVDLSVSPSPSDSGAPGGTVGLIVGFANNVSISNSSVSGEIYLNNPTVTSDIAYDKYDYIGGIAGAIENGTVSDIQLDVRMTSGSNNVNSIDRVGSVVGETVSSNFLRIRADIDMDLHSSHSAGTALRFIGGFLGRTEGSGTLSQICVNHVSSNFSVDTSAGAEINGFAGQIIANPSMSFDEITVKGNLTYNMAGTLAIKGVGATWGAVSVNDLEVGLNTNIVNGTPAAPWAGLDGLFEPGSSSTYSNILITSHHTVNPSFASASFGVSFDTDYSTTSMIVLANDDGLPASNGWPAFPAPPNGIHDSRANIGSRPNGDFVGFDFMSKWQRNTLTNIPELRFCNP